MPENGVLWIWSTESHKELKKKLSPLVKDDGIKLEFVPYIEGRLPGLNINPETDVVMALGGTPLQELKNFGLVKKNLTIGSSRGTVYNLPCDGDTPIRCLTSYSHSIRNVDYSLYIEFVSDLKLAVRLLTTGSLAPPKLDFEWVPDLTEVIDAIRKRQAKFGSIDVAIDLETTGLVPYSHDTWIVTFQISTDEKSSRVVKFDQEFQPRKPTGAASACREELLWEQINYILNDPNISLKGANLKFDLGWIAEKWGIECTNFKHDTLLLGSLLDENRSNSLKTHAFVYTQFGGYEQDLYDNYDIAKPHEVPDDVLLPYCGYDTAVCLQVARKQKDELSSAPENQFLKRFYVKILHPAARAYERVERTGVLVDIDYYTQFKKDLEDKLSSNLKAAHKIIPGRILSKYRDNTDLSRAAMVAEFLFGRTGLNLKPVMFTPKPDKNGNLKPSTALEHFLKFKDDPDAGPFVQVLEEYKDIAKTLSTYVEGFLKHLRYDNRFHASFFLFKGGSGDDDDAGTNSGRISIKDPALQTIPKKTKWAKPLRRGFIAPPGYVFFSGDYSQGELRLAADFSNEEKMIWAYNNSMDLHAVTGAGLADIPVEEFMSYKESDDKDLVKIFEVNRQKAKGANFGLLYGMGAEGFQLYAETAYKVKMTLAEATEARDKFFATYPGLLPWHERTKALALQQGYIMSPLGRIRHLPLLRSPDKQVASKELRRSVNAPVQGTLSDMSLWATAILDKQGHTKKAPICLMVHDQLCAYLPEDNWQYYAKIYKDTMENLPFEQIGWTPKVKFEVDVQVSLGGVNKDGIYVPPNLADLTDLKKLGVTL